MAWDNNQHKGPISMKVFLSWSGARSRQMALALRDWLPMVLQHVHVWMSDRDIPAGERWATQIGRELEASGFGIICLTAENMNAPWVLFEAGALARSLSEAAVCPLLVDIDFTDLTSSPLTQFQAKKVGQAGMRELTAAINARSETPLSDEIFARAFDALWPQLEQRIHALPPTAEKAPAARPVEEVLEDLVRSIRDLESRFAPIERQLAGGERLSPLWRTIRDFAEAQLLHSSYRELAGRIGISPEGVRKLIIGAPPSTRNAHALLRWYLTEMNPRPEPEAPDSPASRPEEEEEEEE